MSLLRISMRLRASINCFLVFSTCASAGPTVISPASPAFLQNAANQVKAISDLRGVPHSGLAFPYLGKEDLTAPFNMLVNSFLNVLRQITALEPRMAKWAFIWIFAAP